VVSDAGYRSFDDLEGGALPVTGGRTTEQCSNGVNRLPISPDHASDIALTQLHFEDGCSSTRDFRQHHVVWKFNELPDHELEKLFHGEKLTTNEHESTRNFVFWEKS
jgi:hypothetical protein